MCNIWRDASSQFAYKHIVRLDTLKLCWKPQLCYNIDPQSFDYRNCFAMGWTQSRCHLIANLYCIAFETFIVNWISHRKPGHRLDVRWSHRRPPLPASLCSSPGGFLGPSGHWHAYALYHKHATHKFRHIHQSIFTVSNLRQVNSNVNNWCVRIHISGG